ncbi:serine proteinase stubble-like [Lacerta agilis]|uniref:serine proteinase stubble-like n=1 Tax=Lacerta agilis TaxID=80427 RepID=UPI001419B821|nr:serine proteinase stubble-like [Lacerta agilis]
MVQFHYQKRKRKVQRCCICFVEVLSGFLLLLLVATVFTLLRCFLEFSDLTLANTVSKAELLKKSTTPTKGLAFLRTAPHTSTVNEIISQQPTVPMKLVSPQASSQTKMVSPPSTTAKSNPETSLPPLISVMQSSSPQQPALSTKLRSTQLDLLIQWMPPQQLTLAAEPSPQPTTTTKLESPHQLTSDVKPVMPQHSPSAMEESPGKPVTPATKWPSPTQLSSATKQKFVTRPTATVQPMPQHLTKTATSASPLWLAAATKLRSPQISSAMTSSPPQLTQFTSLPSLQQLTTAMKGTTSTMKSIFLLQLMTSYGVSTLESSSSEATKLEYTINNTFAKGVLNLQYRRSSTLELKAGPKSRTSEPPSFRRGTQSLKLSPNNVTQEMKRGYRETHNETGVQVDAENIHIEDYSGFCLSKPSLLSVNGVGDNAGTQKDHKSNWGGKDLQNNGKWPWAATVLKGGEPICAGSLIAENWVLSARSCVESGNISLYSVKLASAEQISSDELYPVAKITSRSSGAQDDVALVQLAKLAPITSTTRPICLPDPLHVVPPGTGCWAIGSKERGAAHPDILQWTMTSLDSCVPTSSLVSTCAQPSNLKKEAQLSTGGLFVCPGEDGQLYLEGIFTSSVESQSKGKEISQSATFVRVAPLVPWISSQLLPKRGVRVLGQLKQDPLGSL